MSLATLVEGKELLETVLASLLLGVGVTAIFAIAIWGVGRFSDLSRDERTLAAGLAATVASAAFACVAAAVVIGIIAVTKK
jgi:hypothetical protein